jgi:hypothetical protein
MIGRNLREILAGVAAPVFGGKWEMFFRGVQKHTHYKKKSRGIVQTAFRDPIIETLTVLITTSRN